MSSLAFASGILLGLRARESGKFWTYLICGLVITTPLYAGGYTWYDEIFAAAFVAMNLPARLRIHISLRDALYLVFLIYLLGQAVRGIVFFSDFGFDDAVTKVRWVVFVLLLLVIYFRSQALALGHGSEGCIALAVVKAGIVFNVVYLLYGIGAVALTGSISFTQFAMISETYRVGTSPLLAIFGSTAYVASVFLVIVAASAIVIMNEDGRKALLGWASIALCLATQMLYNSRSGMLWILLLVPLMLIQYFRSRRVLVGLAAFGPMLALAVVVQITLNENPLGVILEDLANTIGIGPASELQVVGQDIDRKIWNAAAVVALFESWPTFLFGTGLRTSGYVIVPYVADLYGASGLQTKIGDFVGLPGFAAMALDIGMLGMAIFYLLVIAASLRVLNVGIRPTLLVAAIPIAFAAHLFVGTIFDVLLMYLILMPGGAYDAMVTQIENRRQTA